jgi:hypothetical protein
VNIETPDYFPVCSISAAHRMKRLPFPLAQIACPPYRLSPKPHRHILPVMVVLKIRMIGSNLHSAKSAHSGNAFTWAHLQASDF